MAMDSKSTVFQLGAGALLLLSLSACSSSGDGGSPPVTSQATAPTVLSSTPVNGGNSVPVNDNLSATFSNAMDPASLTTATFTVTSGAPAVAVAGTVIYANSTAVFWPTAHLADNTMFTATITTGALSAAGMAMAAKYNWTFTTGSFVAAGLPVNLGTAGNYVILAKTGISTVPASAVTGNLGLSPAAASYITGFSLSADATNVFSTSPQVTGKIYAANYAVPTPSNLTTAVSDMQLAFTDAAGRAPDVTELGAGNIGGMTLNQGVYKWGSSLLIPTDLTLTGSATDVWIFQIAQNLTLSSSVYVHLAGGALAKNVFWQVAGAVDLGTTSHFEGIVLTYTSANLRTGASINGRLLAQTAVSIDGSTVVEPAP
jgi:Ice-binding-like/Bacterial Ig-like domain